jgi:predicted PurR-regulated permease PerM
MTSADSSSVDQKFLANAMASFIQILALLVMLYWCFVIVSPFISIVLWGMIISIAVYPAHVALTARLGGKAKWSAMIIVLIGLAIIVLPAWYVADSSIAGLQYIGAELEDGNARVPPPNDSVAEWPVIGERVHEIWSAAAINLEDTLNRFEPQLKAAGQKALAFAGHTAGTVLQFIVSMIIAGTLLMSAEGGKRTAHNIIVSLVGTERGPGFTDLSILTVRSVAKGVLGTAFIQALASGIGLAIAGIPAAGLWAGVVLVVAIIQLPPLLILGPIAFWFFSVAETVPAVIFLIFAIVVSASDAVLKPMLLGRGLDTPMLVILIGAIGGAIANGIIGLFIGAVILAVGYEIFAAWMAPDEAQEKLADSQAK